jgi:hypothetical protein
MLGVFSLIELAPLRTIQLCHKMGHLREAMGLVGMRRFLMVLEFLNGNMFLVLSKALERIMVDS